LRVGDAEAELASAFRDLASGRGVKRGRHSLVVDGHDRTDLFLRALADEGYTSQGIRDAPVELGERVPAFLVRDGVADFGWVFWEKFREGRARKLFGSVHRNAKGDWEIQLGAASSERVFVCLADKTPVDSDRPSSLG
jgi:hypothetical protein